MSDKELDQMTEEELDALAAEQRARIQSRESDLHAAGQLTKKVAKGAAIAAGFRKPDDMRNALKWGRNMGYPRPEKPWPRITLIIGILGLFAAVIPGLGVLYFYWSKKENYKKQCNALLTKWIDAGRPNPDC